MVVLYFGFVSCQNVGLLKFCFNSKDKAKSFRTVKNSFTVILSFPALKCWYLKHRSPHYMFMFEIWQHCNHDTTSYQIWYKVKIHLFLFGKYKFLHSRGDLKMCPSSLLQNEKLLNHKIVHFQTPAKLVFPFKFWEPKGMRLFYLV